MRNTPSKGRPDQWIGDMTVWLRENSPDSSEQMDRLRRNLQAARAQELTPRQQQVLELYYDRHLPTTEIARLLGVRRSTVSRTLCRARARLYKALRYSL